MAALFGKVGRREIDRDVLERQAEADGMQGIADPLAAFGDRFVRQADDGEHVPAAADAHLDLDGPGFDANESDRRNLPVHRVPPRCCGNSNWCADGASRTK